MIRGAAELQYHQQLITQQEAQYFYQVPIFYVLTARASLRGQSASKLIISPPPVCFYWPHRAAPSCDGDGEKRKGKSIQWINKAHRDEAKLYESHVKGGTWSPDKVTHRSPKVLKIVQNNIILLTTEDRQGTGRPYNAWDNMSCFSLSGENPFGMGQTPNLPYLLIYRSISELKLNYIHSYARCFLNYLRKVWENCTKWPLTNSI